MCLFIVSGRIRGLQLTSNYVGPYFILQFPMDLSTMIKKAKKHKYPTEEDLLDDFSLIVDNCMEYNGDDSGE